MLNGQLLILLYKSAGCGSLLFQQVLDNGKVGGFEGGWRAVGSMLWFFVGSAREKSSADAAAHRHGARLMLNSSAPPWRLRHAYTCGSTPWPCPSQHAGTHVALSIAPWKHPKSPARRSKLTQCHAHSIMEAHRHGRCACGL
eukprot:365532-Chlamydomonas_euryale.AAC.14